MTTNKPLHNKRRPTKLFIRILLIKVATCMAGALLCVCSDLRMGEICDNALVKAFLSWCEILSNLEMEFEVLHLAPFCFFSHVPNGGDECIS